MYLNMWKCHQKQGLRHGTLSDSFQCLIQYLPLRFQIRKFVDFVIVFWARDPFQDFQSKTSTTESQGPLFESFHSFELVFQD